MKILSTKNILVIIVITLFFSCGDVTKKVEDKMNLLNTKTLMLDSIINNKLESVGNLDSLIDSQSGKIQKLDSVFTDSTTKIDSIAKDKIDKLKKLMNR